MGDSEQPPIGNQEAEMTGEELFERAMNLGYGRVFSSSAVITTARPAREDILGRLEQITNHQSPDEIMRLRSPFAVSLPRGRSATSFSHRITASRYTNMAEIFEIWYSALYSRTKVLP